MNKNIIKLILIVVVVFSFLAADASAAIDWYERIIKEDFRGIQDIYADDFDQDGLVDIIGAAYSLQSIAWWRNRGNNRFAIRYITTNFDGANSVVSG